jgi:hypothetical protein
VPGTRQTLVRAFARIRYVLEGVSGDIERCDVIFEQPLIVPYSCHRTKAFGRYRSYLAPRQSVVYLSGFGLLTRSDMRDSIVLEMEGVCVEWVERNCASLLKGRDAAGGPGEFADRDSC